MSKPNIRSWEDANKYLGEKVDRPVENNTRVHRLGNGDIAIKLHATDIVTYCFNGPFILNSGGWKTVTTKDRMNKYMPRNLSVDQMKGQWWVHMYDRTESGTALTRNKYAYSDGMKISQDGRILFGSTADHRRTERLNKLLDKFIKKMLALPELPMPEPGDCIVCRFLLSDQGCLESHLDEGYVHGSLIWNATRARKYGNPALVLQLRADGWKNGERRVKTDVARDVRKFFREKLGLVR